MKEHNLTGKDIADIAGVVPSAVAKWKNGGKIGVEKLEKIASHFGESIDWLLGRASKSVTVSDLPKNGEGSNPQCIADLPESPAVRESTPAYGEGDAVALSGRALAENIDLSRKVDELTERIARLEMLRDPAVQAQINAYVEHALREHIENEAKKKEGGQS